MAVTVSSESCIKLQIFLVLNTFIDTDEISRHSGIFGVLEEKNLFGESSKSLPAQWLSPSLRSRASDYRSFWCLTHLFIVTDEISRPSGIFGILEKKNLFGESSKSLPAQWLSLSLRSRASNCRSFWCLTPSSLRTRYLVLQEYSEFLKRRISSENLLNLFSLNGCHCLFGVVHQISELFGV
ncbi:hypothetical protein AVEN_204849-1 [Araneus ventricosus]|uniref:Uncharacterized protein n=1 Tax=Araneus ventricosus TaxID=182803 RepID=A0A4Y2VHE8_ARAVE|nr:hypothetical protein AVEN_204849-1 [Araneus ventricosus]